MVNGGDVRDIGIPMERRINALEVQTGEPAAVDDLDGLAVRRQHRRHPFAVRAIRHHEGRARSRRQRRQHRFDGACPGSGQHDCDGVGRNITRWRAHVPRHVRARKIRTRDGKDLHFQARAARGPKGTRNLGSNRTDGSPRKARRHRIAKTFRDLLGTGFPAAEGRRWRRVLSRRAHKGQVRWTLPPEPLSSRPGTRQRARPRYPLATAIAGRSTERRRLLFCPWTRDRPLSRTM